MQQQDRMPSRWWRGDAARWVRPDAARWFKPGVDLRGVFPALAHKAFNPNQPRVPAGRPDGGQWTDEEGAPGSGLATPMGEINFGDISSEIGSLGLSEIRPRESGQEVGIQLVGDPPTMPDRLLNQHILRNHVGQSDEELTTRIRQNQLRGLFISIGMERNGSFESEENARDYIRRTLELNPDTVQQVSSGQQREAFLSERFGEGTGREAVLDRETDEIRVRKTFNVGVAIANDPRSPAGYRVITAYPRNYNPRLGF